MNIALNTQIPAAATADTDTMNITYNASAQGINASGYKLDIADNKVMDNEAYGHGLTTDDVMQQAANTDVNVQGNFMLVMSSSVSGEDMQRMQEDGFNPMSTDVETYVNITDKIKVELAQAGVVVEGYTDDLDVDKVEEITGSLNLAESIVSDLSSQLAGVDMPVTDENVEALAEAVSEASNITELSDEAIKYLTQNQKEPTIENLYKAQYVGGGEMRQPQGYYSDGISGASYYAKKADNINWDNLQSRIDAVVSEAGLDADGETKAAAVENAKWLVESGVELNAENLAYVTDLKNLTLPMELSDIESICVTALENGKSPRAALMTGETSIAEKARELVEDVNAISDEAVHEAVESGSELNIKNLSQIQRDIDAAADEASTNTKAVEMDGTEISADISEDISFEETQARRQLEEIRLMMTQEANRQLLKSGVSIDTTQLSELVDALKETEAAMQAVMFKGESAQDNAQRALIYDETLAKTDELKDMPAAVVGRMAFSGQAYTLNRLHNEGAELRDEMQGDADKGNDRRQAAQAYETLMTAPRHDMGDSIRKAFRNVDDILDDMDLETSDANRRAVRILGYNSMEITHENINTVKAADSEVTGVISRMTPAATLQMIRDQKNPLEMTIGELDEYLNGQDGELESSSQKYSEFLQKLDRADGISEQEREAYIGIYRLLHQIEQSDGAVIGSVVAAGAEMSFKNMLSAVRSSADKNMDIRIDDGFGALEELITSGRAIDSQIESGFSQDGQKDLSNGSENRQQERYYARLSGEINTELARNTDVNRLPQVNITAETTIEQFGDSIKSLRMDADMQAQLQSERLKAYQENLREAMQVSEQTIETLVEYGQPVSLDNIEAVQLLMQERGSMFKQIIAGSASEDDDSASDDDVSLGARTDSSILDSASDFIERLDDGDSAARAYGEMIDEAKEAVEEMIYRTDSDIIDIRAAQSLCKGLSLAGSLAREENYEIPMEIGGEITSVNLKIYHNTDDAGKISVTMDSALFGKVAAELSVSSESVSGMVAYENKSAQPQMEAIEQSFLQALQESGIKKVSVSLAQSNALDLSRFGGERQTADGEDGKISTARLYRTAKAFLKALGQTNSTDNNREV